MAGRPLSGARPTLEDVAAVAGVSRATASRVLNSSPRVSPEAHEAVTAAALQLGYEPNQAARTLVTRRTGAIAMLMSEPQAKVFDDPHFGALVRAAASELARIDMQVVLMLVHGEGAHSRAERFLRGGHVDGALLFTPHQDDPLPSTVRKLHLPVIFGGRPWGSLRGLYTVDNDNEGGGVLATEHLLSLGRKTIVTVTGPEDELSSRDRIAGWARATGAGPAEITQLTECGDYTREGGYRAMNLLLHRVPKVDGVFAANDLMAVGCLQALREHGRTVPEDVAVVGFDDNQMIAPHTDPPLTTVRQDLADQVRKMISNLMTLVDGGSVRRREVLPVQLVRRESA
ncbi:DNA-binding LacI/PurR family transcriptional regulator [Kibdelosporangium banguiense]|uniref:DNA-binding LacI/PurR family transcriptional regulator n=1 Tax=Kibdelosporangium banguiense TaxID=1365924 RepID=A0ABS4TI85_9PSEU|nr:LacI family DNA-binding transcriptional regulator [Kibdelosporangium banguiense]MBP2324137.1 DNA-binding LacI/PurR family transcriptional regulator [Kibdelosporangium banguiense]